MTVGCTEVSVVTWLEYLNGVATISCTIANICGAVVTIVAVEELTGTKSTAADIVLRTIVIVITWKSIRHMAACTIPITTIIRTEITIIADIWSSCT